MKGFHRGLSGGHKHSITHDLENGNILRLKRTSGDEKVAENNWSCGSAHHHAHDDDDNRVHHIFEDENHVHHHNDHQHVSKSTRNIGTSTTDPAAGVVHE